MPDPGPVHYVLNTRDISMETAPMSTSETASDSRSKLLALVKEKSVFYGDFTLASGAKSNFYIDCRLSALDPEGACLIGDVLHDLIVEKARELGVEIDAIGGLTLGADPISLSIAMSSHLKGREKKLQAFVVRKEPKGYGKGKQIEGNFHEGDTVVAIDDTVTTGGSTLKAIEAIEAAGGKVAFVAVLVDRDEGAREKIAGAGYPMIAAFTKGELLDE